MTRRNLFRLSLVLAVLLTAAARVPPVHAQPVLVDATPAPGAVLTDVPPGVALTFDRALSEREAWIRVTAENGEQVDREDSRVDPDNRFVLLVALDPLPEGRYTVTYQVTSPGSSTIVAGRYEFVVDLPEPTLEMLSPLPGEAFSGTQIPLEMRVRFFDFGLYNNRIRLYIDGALYAELRELSYTIEDLEPGVHEIRTVLARYEDEELPETTNVAFVAVAQPDTESEGRALAALATPDPGLRLTPLEMGGVVALTLVLLALGIGLGQTGGQRRTPSPADDERPPSLIDD